MNTPFTAYDLSTGQVRYAGTASDPGSLATEVLGILQGHKLEGGWMSAGVHYTQPDKPSKHHIFDWQTKTWFDPRTLSDLKAAKWLEIKKHRDTLEGTSFPYLGKDIDSDVVSVLRINTAVKAADHAQATNTAFSTEWRCADNTLLTLDGPGLQMMPVALAVYARSLHSHANTLRAQLDLASTPEELNSVAW